LRENKGVFKSSNLQKQTTMTEWRDEAACKGMEAKKFFPDPTYDYKTVTNIKSIQEAKAVCSSCLVQQQCLDHGMSEPLGIWGGKTKRERAAIRKTNKGVTE